MVQTRFDASGRNRFAAILLSYDDTFTTPNDSRECCFSLTAPQVDVLLALTEYLDWATRWYSETHQVVDEDVIQEFGNDIRRRLMSGCCDDEIIIYRENPTTGAIEQSSDGGVNWLPSPIDPQNHIIQLPPMPDEGHPDKKCDAATNATNNLATFIAQYINQLNTSATEIEFLLAMLAVWLLIFAGGQVYLLPVLLGGLAHLLFGLTAEGLTAAFTNDTYDEFKCAVYNNVGEDGQFDDTGLAALKADIPNIITDSTAQGVVLEHLNVLQLKGINYWCLHGSASGQDCSGCAGCANGWDTWDIYTGTGIINEETRTKCVIEIEAEFFNGSYAVILHGADSTDCNHHNYEAISGSLAGGIFWKLCGEDVNPTVDYHTGILGSDANIDGVYYTSPVAFTVRMTAL